MRNSEIISLGALAALTIAALGVGRYAAATAEQELAAAAQTTLTNIGFQQLTLEADGMVLAVSGRVRSEAELQVVLDRLQEVEGISNLYNNIVVVAPLADLRPSLLILEKDTETLTLSGEAPSLEARDLLVARAEGRHPDRVLVNLMRAQDGRPSEAWVAAAEAAVDALALVDIGRAAVERQRMRLEGASAQAGADARIKRRLEERLGSDYAIEVSVNAPPPLRSPYRFAARKTSRGVEVLECAAPDAAQRSVILGATRGLGPGATGADAAACEIALGAPNEEWVAAVVRATTALAPLDEGEVEISDSRALLRGFAPPGANLENLRLAAAAQWPEGYQLTVEVQANVPFASPFAMTALRRPGATTLSGHAPTLERAETWARTLDATNRLTLARGAPEGWIEAANAALEELSRLPVGAATIQEGRILLAAPGDASLRAQIRERLGERVPPGYEVEVAEARPPGPVDAPEPPPGEVGEVDRSAYSFAASRTRDGAVVVSGVIGDPTTRTVVLAYARAKLGGEALTDEMALAEGGVAPAGWQRAVFASIEALSELEEGEAAAEPGAVYLRGDVPSADLARRARMLLEEKAPVEFSRFSNLRVREPVALDAADRSPLSDGDCVAVLNAQMAEAPIRFGSGSAAIEAASDAVLQTLTDTLSRCPAAAIEIGGHTDSSGRAEANKRLSEQRAEAVLQGLTTRGAAAGRLTAVGYGSDEPIADNRTEAGKARNRRIAFKLR